MLIGSDKVRHWDTYGDEITKYQPLLDALKPDTAEKVGGGTLFRILEAVPVVKLHP